MGGSCQRDSGEHRGSSKRVQPCLERTDISQSRFLPRCPDSCPLTPLPRKSLRACDSCPPGGGRHQQTKSFQTRETFCAPFGGHWLEFGPILPLNSGHRPHETQPPTQDAAPFPSFHCFPPRRPPLKASPNPADHNEAHPSPAQGVWGSEQPRPRLWLGLPTASFYHGPSRSSEQTGRDSTRYISAAGCLSSLCLPFSQNIGDEFANGPGL